MNKLYPTLGTRNLPQIQPAVLDCLYATEALCAALVIQQTIDLDFLKKIGSEHPFLAPLSDNIIVLNPETGARLEFNFFDNRIVTVYQGETKNEKLSCVLGIICDVSEVFVKIQQTKSQGAPPNSQARPTSKSDSILMLEKKPKLDVPVSVESDNENFPMENQLSEALALSTSTVVHSSNMKSQKQWKLIIDEKEVVAFYFDTKRVVFSGMRGIISTPMLMLGNCGHLFNEGFVKEIAPVLDIKPKMKQLLSTLHKIYLGRCLLSLIKSSHEYSQQKYQHELDRIVCHILAPGHGFYTEPLHVKRSTNKNKEEAIVIHADSYDDVNFDDPDHRRVFQCSKF